MSEYVPGKGSGGAGSQHKGQYVKNEGGQGSVSSPVGNYPSTSMGSVADTPRPKDNSKKSPKPFG